MDVFTGEKFWVGSEFPRESGVTHIWGTAFFVGAVAGGDTLVSSTGFGFNYEFNPDPAPFGEIRFRSTLSSNPLEKKDAISEEDYIAVYTDTFLTWEWSLVGYDYFRNRPHVPINIEITENSYAWSLGYAEDFIIFDMAIKNIGKKDIEKPGELILK